MSWLVAKGKPGYFPTSKSFLLSHPTQREWVRGKKSKCPTGLLLLTAWNLQQWQKKKSCDFFLSVTIVQLSPCISYCFSLWGLFHLYYIILAHTGSYLESTCYSFILMSAIAFGFLVSTSYSLCMWFPSHSKLCLCEANMITTTLRKLATRLCLTCPKLTRPDLDTVFYHFF